VPTEQNIQLGAVITMVVTQTDAGAQWSLGDEIVRFREWGTDRSYTLPLSPVSGYVIGTADDCSLRFDDPHISRKHARLTHVNGKWSISDLGSKNGLRLDGIQQHEPCVLEPGAEIGLGRVILVAESGQWIALRGFCARILGWANDRTVRCRSSPRSAKRCSLSPDRAVISQATVTRAGWLALGRGMHDLLLLELGRRARGQAKM
jgi:hypothetical protein